MPAFNKNIKRDLKGLTKTAKVGEKGGNYLDPALLYKMTDVVGSSIVKVLENYKFAQPNLGSETMRYKIASEILDDIIIKIRGKNGRSK